MKMLKLLYGDIISETVMAEKVETILSRGVFTTRPRDFYDVYIFLELRRSMIKKFLKKH